jgi:hypothetical protein
MIGLMDKSGLGSPMQTQGGNLAALFQNLPQGQPVQVPQIMPPQLQQQTVPSPDQAAAATRERLMARAPIIPPAAPADPAAAAKPKLPFYGRGSGR